MSPLLVAALTVAVAAAVRGTWSPCGLSMVSAINPFSETSRGNRYALTCLWFVLGAVAGGLLLGAGAAAAALLLGPLPTPAALLLGAAAALVGLAADVGLPGVRLPLHPRQVDETWLGRYRRWVYAAGFGAQIGAGLATYVMTAATYLLVVLAALNGSPGAALAVGAAFGLVRGLAVLLTARARTPAALRALHRRLEQAAPWSLRAAALTQGLVAVALAAAALGPRGAVGALVLAGLVAAGAARPAAVRRHAPAASRVAARAAR